MANTVESAMKTLREIDGLIERIDLAKDGSEISGRDMILIVTILEKVRSAILSSAAYPSIEIEDEEVSA